MVVERIAAVQALAVGMIFAWAGIWKVFSPEARRIAAQSALGKLLPTPQITLAAHLAVGLGELAVALLLLASPWHGLGMRVATVFALGFLGYLALAHRLAPERPCACMGGRATRISRRSVLRALALFALTLAGWAGQESWAVALLGAPWLALFLLIEMILLWLLSPEFGWPGARYERRVMRAARLWLNPSCSWVSLDWDALEQSLRATRPFKQLAPLLDTVTDRWREGCWSFISFAARYDDHPATAVFAIPTLFDAQEVSAALVDDSNNAVVLNLPSARGALPPAQ